VSFLTKNRFCWRSLLQTEVFPGINPVFARSISKITKNWRLYPLLVSRR